MDHYFDGFGRPFKTGVKKITYLTKNEVRIITSLKLVLYLFKNLLTLSDLPYKYVLKFLNTI